MSHAPSRELQDHSGPKLISHGSSVVGIAEPNRLSGLRQTSGPLYAHPTAVHRGFSVGKRTTVHRGQSPIEISTRKCVISSRTLRDAQSWMSSFISSLSVGPSRKAADLGASEFVGGAGRTQQKGELIGTQHAVSFPSRQLVSQPVIRSPFSMKALMESLALPLLGRLNAPSVVPTSLVLRCKTFREAVRMAWAYRRVHFMTLRQLAIDGGFYPQHVGDWLNPDDKPTRRSLPAECIARFEVVVGNTLCSQWLAHRSALTVLETMQADRALA